MEVFEFQINPKLRKNLIFESFCYSPKNIFEKKLGYLFCVGELKNFPQKKATFLSQFSIFLKETFYKNFSKKPKFAFKETLKKANLYLEELLKKGEDFWCFNLNFVVINFFETNFIFSKTGNFKILLFQSGVIFDLERKIKEKKVGLKVFNKIINGKLKEGETILVLNQEIFDLLKKDFKKLYEIDETNLRNFLKEREEFLKKTSGIIFGIYLKKREKERTFPEKFEIKKIWESFPLPKFNKEELFSILKKKSIILVLLFFLVLILGKILTK